MMLERRPILYFCSLFLLLPVMAWGFCATSCKLRKRYRFCHVLVFLARK
uniref:Uncharacterized protein n=1 Tax=Rhizophora mucronata TaxID=61149 RepID=A0A2P2PWS2_RHIMU